MDTLAKILNLILAQGLSDLEFTEKAGIYRTSVAEWKNGKTKSYRKHLPKIAEALGVDVNYLIDEGTAKSPADILSEAFETKPYSLGVPVPVFGTIRAGFNGLAFEELDGYKTADVQNPKEFIWLRVKGDSMEPVIHDGCFALIHLTDKDIINGKVYACIINSNEGTLKRVFQQGDGSYMLSPYNGAHPPEIVAGEHLIIVGRLKKTLCDEY